jgi:ComF family protein
LLGRLLAEHLRGREAPLPGLIVPVPLHRQRLRERGFNQALELARTVAAHLGVTLEPHCCTRVRATGAQTELTARERRTNVRGAFRMEAPLAARHVAILDDVVTTGSTVQEVARVLASAGAERIEVWACARAAPAR